MGWPCSSSSIARLIRFGFGVWATVTVTPNSTHKLATTPNSFIAALLLCSWVSIHPSNQRQTPVPPVPTRPSAQRPSAIQTKAPLVFDTTPAHTVSPELLLRRLASPVLMHEDIW